MTEKVPHITAGTGLVGSVAVMSALERPRHGKVIAGVCAGLAQRYGWKPNTVRAVFIVSCLLPGPQFLLYLVLWLLLPESA